MPSFFAQVPKIEGMLQTFDIFREIDDDDNNNHDNDDRMMMKNLKDPILEHICLYV